MSLQLVFGPAGSGKSTILQNRIIDMAIKNPGQQFLLIVPDQFTMQTQMDIVKKHPNGGIMNIDVLSFSRLTYRVFSEAGGPDTPVLDDTGKSLVLRHVASEVMDKMPYIGANLNKIGYIHEVKSMISEFMQYGISVKDVEKLSDSIEQKSLKSKLDDLKVIYEAFMKYNRDKFITNEETLSILCNKLPEAEFVKNSYIVFDGFTGFTPIQENVIMKLLELAEKVVVTLTLSAPERPEETGSEEKLFYLTRTSGNRLRSFAGEKGITVEADEIISNNNGRFLNNPEINHLEKNIFRYTFSQYDKVPDNIFAFRCSGIEHEITEISLRIHELVRKEGYAYRDIAVIVGDLEAYGDIFENRMKELNIPCFVDRTSGIVLNPFIEYLKSAMSVVIKDYSYDSVFHYLKSGFADYDEDSVDRFGKYAESLNIRGKSQYYKPFTKRQKGMQKEFAIPEIANHEALRIKLWNEISVLSRPAETAKDYVKNLYEFLKNNDSYNRLKEYENMFEAANNLSKAKEYGQIYRLIMELLDTIYNLIGDEKMNFSEFYKIFEAGISEIQVGTIPRNVDRVVVGDIERTRLNEIKVLFMAGVNDGNIPRVVDSAGILSNNEREIIVSKKYNLSPTDKTKIYTQRLYLYSNLCKPKDKLFVSFSETDREGKGIRQSYLIATLTRLFPKLEIQKADDSLTAERIVNLKDSYRFYSDLVSRYSEKMLSEPQKRLTESLMKLYLEEDPGLCKKITDAAFYEYMAGNLSREIVKLIYGESINASISRMELYAKCAYSHFLKYGMELKEKEEAFFDAVDLGSVYHGVLDVFASQLEAKGLSFETVSEEETTEMVRKAVQKYCEEYEQGILGEDAQTKYIVNKITRILERAVDTIKYQIKQGSFAPKMHEHPFVRQVPLDSAMMNLKGRIDRVDIYDDGEKIYVRIVDYKSGSRSIDITNVYHGIEQQLPLYMAEAIYHEQQLNPGKEVVPAAMFYYKVADPLVEAGAQSADKDVEELIRKELKFDGMLSDSPDIIEAMDKDATRNSTVLPITFYPNGTSMYSNKKAVPTESLANMAEYTEKLVKEIGERIYAGDITVNPMHSSNERQDACKYCNYKSICRLDSKIRGFKERDGRETDEAEIRTRVLGGGKDGLYLFD